MLLAAVRRLREDPALGPRLMAGQEANRDGVMRLFDRASAPSPAPAPAKRGREETSSGSEEEEEGEKKKVRYSEGS